MRAALYQAYGGADVVEIRDIEKPVPADDEILIRTHAATVTSADWRARSLEMPSGFGMLGRLVFGVARPRQPVLGSELAGEVESVGAAVTKFTVGDRVFAFDGMGMGCHAEYRCLRENAAIARIPAGLGYAEAAPLSFGGTTALSFFRRGRLEKGEKVLVNGASGGVGTAAVQLARHFGAEVTGVCSARNAELVRSLGAHRVIDYHREDFAASGETYDVIVDTAGTAPMSRSMGSLKEGGRLLLVLGGLADMLRTPWVAATSSKRVVAGPAIGRSEDLRFLAGLAAAGTFSAFIDRRYPLEEIAEAHRYVDSGRKRGNVVITMGSGS